MAKTVHCPTCGRVRSVPEQFAAPEVTCTACGTRYRTASGVLVRMNADRDISERGLFYLKGSRVLAVIAGVATAGLGAFLIYQSSSIVNGAAGNFTALVWAVIVMLIGTGITYLVCGSRMGSHTSDRGPVAALAIAMAHGLLALQCVHAFGRWLFDVGLNGNSTEQTWYIIFWWRGAALYSLILAGLVYFLVRYLIEDYLAKLQRDDAQRLSDGTAWKVVCFSAVLLAVFSAARWINMETIDVSALIGHAAAGGVWRYGFAESMFIGPLLIAGYVWCAWSAAKRRTRAPLITMLVIAGLQISALAAQHVDAIWSGTWAAQFSDAAAAGLSGDAVWVNNEVIWLTNGLSLALLVFLVAGVTAVVRQEEYPRPEGENDAFLAAVRVLSGCRMATLALGMIAGMASILGALILLGALAFSYVPIDINKGVLPGIRVLWLCALAAGYLALGAIYVFGGLRTRTLASRMPWVVLIAASIHAGLIACGFSPANAGGGDRDALFVNIAYLLLLLALILSAFRVTQESRAELPAVESEPGPVVPTAIGSPMA